MKKKYFSYLLAATLCLYSCKRTDEFTSEKVKINARSDIKPERINGLYYWSIGERHALNLDSTSVIFFDPDSARTISTLRSKNKETSIRKLESGYFFAKGQSRAELIKISKNAIVQDVYKTIKGEQAVPTGELSLRPKPGISIENIISKSGANLTVLSKSRRGNSFLLKYIGKESILDLANKIYESGDVVFSIPNFIAPVKSASNDQYFNQQYYLKETTPQNQIAGINLGTALGVDENIKVAVLDDGVEAHEDIPGRLLQGYTPLYPTEYGAPIDDPNPYGRIIGHGQACAGIIGASRDNIVGVAGIAPKAKIIPVNILRPGGPLTAAQMADAIEWAWAVGGADVLNNSWGYDIDLVLPEVEAAIGDALTYGRGGKGCVVVFAAGNYNDLLKFPANLPGVLTVGAITKSSARFWYSSYGSSLELVAPSGELGYTDEWGVVHPNGDIMIIDRMGVKGYNTSAQGHYTTTFGGTSAACPQVAGAAALLLSLKPELTTAQITSYLTTTADDIGATGFDSFTGYGRLNVSKAFNKVFNDYFTNLRANVYEFTNPSLYKHAYNLDPSMHTQFPGWNPNGQPFKAYATNYNNSVPIYQFTNPNTHDHVLTPLTNPGWSAYNNNGVLFYAYATQIPGTVPVYEFWSAIDTDHFYSTNINAAAPYGGWWTYNTLAFYAYAN